jgi:hypothetical protein
MLLAAGWVVKDGPALTTTVATLLVTEHPGPVWETTQ